MKILSFLAPFNSKIKTADFFNILSVKFFGKGLLFLKIWHIRESTIVEVTGHRTWKQNWKQTFDCKLVYILGKTVQDMVLDSYLQQIASSQVTSVWCFECYFWNQQNLFLVLLLLTLNIVFLAKLHNCNLLSYRNKTPPKTSPGLFSRAS